MTWNDDESCPDSYKGSHLFARSEKKSKKNLNNNKGADLTKDDDSGEDDPSDSFFNAFWSKTRSLKVMGLKRGRFTSKL